MSSFTKKDLHTPFNNQAVNKLVAVLNTDLGDVSSLQKVTGGISSVVMGNADYVLSAADYANGTLAIISSTNLTTTRNVVAPLTAGLRFVVQNSTSGSQSIVFKGASGTGPTIPSGGSMEVFCDGTNWSGVLPANVSTLTTNVGALQASTASLSVPVTGSVAWTLTPPTGGSPSTGAFDQAFISGYLSLKWGTAEKVSLSRITTFGQDVTYVNIPTGSFIVNTNGNACAMQFGGTTAGSFTQFLGDHFDYFDTSFNQLMVMATAGITVDVPVGGDSAASPGIPFQFKRVTKSLSANTDYTLSQNEESAVILEFSGTTGGSTNILASNHPGAYKVIKNDTTANLVVKVSGQTGVTIANGKKATIYCDGTDYVRATADV